MTEQQHISKQGSTMRLAAAIAGLLLAFPALRAQSIPVQRPENGSFVPDTQTRAFDAAHLSERPYAFNLPKPQFPSTERKQREFVVEYIYEYAVSDYAPAVKLPVISRQQAQRDTPENALIAFFAAMRSSDYAGWLECWDDAGQKQLTEQTKDGTHDVAFWKNTWAQIFGPQSEILLQHRVETERYVILDVKVNGPHAMTLPTVLRYADKKWYVTNELSTNPMLYRFNPKLAGLLNLVPPLPTDHLDRGTGLQAEAQQKFLEQHNIRNRVAEAGH